MMLQRSNGGLTLDADETQTAPHHRYLALVCVAALHLAVLWALVAGMRPTIGARLQHDLEVTVFNPAVTPREAPAPPLSWMFEAPQEALVPEPEIDIAPDEQTPGGIAAAGITQMLAPRLDPAHLNAPPFLPSPLDRIAKAAQLELRILVLPDGSVGDAEIVKSTGQGVIDRLGTDFVRASWRFLPALANGRPIEAWSTVIVRFSAVP
jgi:protein TonB